MKHITADDGRILTPPKELEPLLKGAECGEYHLCDGFHNCNHPAQCNLGITAEEITKLVR